MQWQQSPAQYSAVVRPGRGVRHSGTTDDDARHGAGVARLRVGVGIEELGGLAELDDQVGCGQPGEELGDHMFTADVRVG